MRTALKIILPLLVTAALIVVAYLIGVAFGMDSWTKTDWFMVVTVFSLWGISSAIHEAAGALKSISEQIKASNSDAFKKALAEHREFVERHQG